MSRPDTAAVRIASVRESEGQDWRQRLCLRLHKRDRFIASLKLLGGSGVEGGLLEGIIEAVKFFGGLSGLASGAFLVYDRLLKNQPLIFLVAQEYKAALRLKNVAQENDCH
jgi:hypothetical protein